MNVEIKYLERPATKQEIEIAAAFERAVKAAVAGDSILLESVFTPDAKIYLLTKTGEEMLQRDKFVEKITKTPKQFRALSYKDVSIRLIGNLEAIVACVCIATLRNAIWPNIFRRCFTLQKRNDAWYIVRLVYFD